MACHSHYKLACAYYLILHSTGTTFADTRIPDMAASSTNTNDGTNSLKSMIVDVLRDMAGKGTSSNTQPDISAVAQAILQAQRKYLSTYVGVVPNIKLS